MRLEHLGTFSENRFNKKYFLSPQERKRSKRLYFIAAFSKLNIRGFQM